MRYGIAVGATAFALVAAAAGARDSGVSAEMFFGGEVPAWLTQRWGLGAWTAFPGLAGESETDGGLLFNPAVRYQRPLWRGRSLTRGRGHETIDREPVPAVRAHSRWEVRPCESLSC